MYRAWATFIEKNSGCPAKRKRARVAAQGRRDGRTADHRQKYNSGRFKSVGQQRLAFRAHQWRRTAIRLERLSRAALASGRVRRPPTVRPRNIAVIFNASSRLRAPWFVAQVSSHTRDAPSTPELHAAQKSLVTGGGALAGPAPTRQEWNFARTTGKEFASTRAVCNVTANCGRNSSALGSNRSLR